MAKRRIIEPGSKSRNAIAERKKLPKRKCIAYTAVRGQCERIFKPKHRFNFVCPLCTDFFSRHGSEE